MTQAPLQESALPYAAPPPHLGRFGRWAIAEYELLPSTNLAAAALPPWHVVRADRQNAGRGRFQRVWVSDLGGLWMSAVVPIAADSGAGRLLPLAAGLAVCRAVRSFEVEGIRMRWPNDVLVHGGKLAGILIDHFVTGRCVVGIGLNVSNQPEACDRSLCGHVARLAELVTPVPSLTEVLQRLLGELDAVCHELDTSGPTALVPAINKLWPGTANVELDLDDQIVAGAFQGIDAAGRLQLRADDGAIRSYEPHQVRLFREMIYP